VYVVVGIAALVCTGLVVMLIILKFGRHSKFGMKGKQGCFLYLPELLWVVWADTIGFFTDSSQKN